MIKILGRTLDMRESMVLLERLQQQVFIALFSAFYHRIESHCLQDNAVSLRERCSSMMAGAAETIVDELEEDCGGGDEGKAKVCVYRFSPVVTGN